MTTGGSSGTPVTVYWQVGYSNARDAAFMQALWRRVDCSLTSKRMVLRGPIVDSSSHMVYKPATRELICSTYHLDDEQMAAYLSAMKARGIRVIHGHVSSVATFASYLVRHRIVYPLHAVLGASEMVFPFQRELVRKAFGARLFSWYGQSERVVLAGECEVSSKYHVFPEYGILELIDEKGALITKPGVAGEIVGTGFNSFAMPLIRYRTGDIGVYASEVTCACGRTYPVLESLEGRKYEYVVSSDGARISLTGLIFGQHFSAFQNIHRLQIYQDVPGIIEVRVLRSGGYTKRDEEEVVTIIERAGAGRIRCHVVYPDDIPLTPAGKHRFLIQRIPLDRGDGHEPQDDFIPRASLS